MSERIHPFDEIPVATGLVEGIRLLVAPVPAARSVSFGVWITAGSRDEPAARSGLFHFIEHLVFKGTPTADARALAFAIDELGGNIDAFTTREVTGYTGHVVAERLPAAFDLVADLTLASTFPADEVERERQVILEEIRMSEDSPSDLMHERIFSSLWGEGPLGRPITGTPATVAAVGRDALLEGRYDHYRADRMVVAAVGNVDYDRMAALVVRRFGGLSQSRT
ncbi:MAG: insulinase family protein, partial [Nitrospinae bacterium]|nr:insulinase family protein [Nitrospinota bacterium]